MLRGVPWFDELLRRLSRRIEERQLRDRDAGLLAPVVDRELHLQLCPDARTQSLWTLASAIIFLSVGDQVVLVALPTWIPSR